MAYSIDLSPFSGFVHHPDQNLTFALLSIRSLFVKTWLTRMFTIPISSLFCSFLPTHVVQRNDWNPVWTLCMHSLHISLHVRMRLICVIYINPVMQTGSLILHGNGMNSEVSNVCFFFLNKVLLCSSALSSKPSSHHRCNITSVPLAHLQSLSLLEHASQFLDG